MTDSLIVLGIDGADYRLLKRWDCTNLLLDNHTELEPLAESFDVPTTLEVWPSIATGVSPAEHGLYHHPENRTTRSPLRRALVRTAKRMPDTIRKPIQKSKDDLVGTNYPHTDHEHVFERGSVSNWPGITRCVDWEQQKPWFRALQEGDLSERAFFERSFGQAGKGIGWLIAQAKAGVPIAGTHIHVLDYMGHVYANRPAKLRETYEQVDELVAILRENVDRLVIVSDHGMVTSVTDDSDPGVHSWHAVLSTTETGPLPDSILGVREWLEPRISTDVGEDSGGSIDAPTEHLKDLGYL